MHYGQDPSFSAVEQYYLLDKFIIQRISVRKTNCVIHWTQINLVDSTIHLLNYRSQAGKFQTRIEQHYPQVNHYRNNLTCTYLPMQRLLTPIDFFFQICGPLCTLHETDCHRTANRCNSVTGNIHADMCWRPSLLKTSPLPHKYPWRVLCQWNHPVIL